MSKKNKKTEAEQIEASKMFLDGMERMTMLRLLAEMKAADLEFTIKSAQRKALAEKIDPKGELDKLTHDLQTAFMAHRKHKTDYETLCAQIEKKFKISMKNYGFDELTGQLILAEPSAPEPVDPKPTS